MQKNTHNHFWPVMILLILFSLFPVIALSSAEATPSPEDQVMQFVDPNVEFLIREGLGIHDRDVLVSDMETVQSFFNYVSAYEYDEDARDYDIKDLSDLAYCTNIKEIGLSNTNLISLEPLRNLQNLDNIWFTNCPNIQDFSLLSTMHSITQVAFRNSDIPPQALAAVLSLPNLTYFSYMSSFNAESIPTDLSPLKDTHSLKIFQINTPVLDYTPLLNHDIQSVWLPRIDIATLQKLLEAWPNLLDFSVHDTPLRNEDLALFDQYSRLFLSLPDCGIDDLSYLHGQLMYLDVSGCPITDLSPLANQKMLESLWMDRCAITDVTPLASITSLHIVSLQNSPITDITPFTKLPYLSSLSISLDDVEDVTQLQNIPSLDFFSFPYTEKYTDEDIQSLLPGVSVNYVY